MTSNTGPILVFPRIQPFGSVDLSSRGKVYSRHVTGSANCENSSVSFVMKYCPTSTVFRNPASVKISITRSCCKSPLYFGNKFFLCRNFSRRCRCCHQQSGWLEHWVRLSCQHTRSCLTSTVFLTLPARVSLFSLDK